MFTVRSSQLLLNYEWLEKMSNIGQGFMGHIFHQFFVMDLLCIPKNKKILSIVSEKYFQIVLAINYFNKQYFFL